MRCSTFSNWQKSKRSTTTKIWNTHGIVISRFGIISFVLYDYYPLGVSFLFYFTNSTYNYSVAANKAVKISVCSVHTIHTKPKSQNNKIYIFLNTQSVWLFCCYFWSILLVSLSMELKKKNSECFADDCCTLLTCFVVSTQQQNTKYEEKKSFSRAENECFEIRCQWRKMPLCVDPADFNQCMLSLFDVHLH